MFGLRADGKKLKRIDPIQKIMPHIMSARHDSQNLAKYEVRCEPFDAFISEEREKGIGINYMHLVIAGLVRTIAKKPRLNRFIMNGRIFRRTGGIYISFVVKRKLSANAADSTVKVCFTGHESIYDVKNMVDEAIKSVNAQDDKNGTDKLATLLTIVPNSIIKFLVWCLKKLDKHGLLPGSILKLSPFHTSCFVTNLKSIKGEYIYHHLYDFGTTSLFVSMGKEKMVPVVDDDQVVPGKVMTLGVVTDERFCDGFYYISALKMLKEFYQNPILLCERLDMVEEDIPFDYKKSKKEAKEKKLKQKEEKRLEKAEIKKQKRKTK